LRLADLDMIGGVAIENIEGWILVLLGVDGESIPSRRTKGELESRGIKTLSQMVDAITPTALQGLPPCSLASWLESARSAFARRQASARTS